MTSLIKSRTMIFSKCFSFCHGAIDLTNLPNAVTFKLLYLLIMRSDSIT